MCSDYIKEKLKNLPLCPGVYIMRDKNGKVIYVGKSKLLKNRVSQYFMQSKNHTPKTVALVSNIVDFDYIVTDTEVEALVLECNLIKKYLPQYNILLKDGKQYPYIKITTQEEYPRIFMTRRVKKDGAKYFGPYMSAYMVKDTLETLKRIFKIRSCHKELPKDIGKSRPCLYYQIGQCSAPCDGRISKEEYREVFDQIQDVMNGKFASILQILEKKMFEASENLEFERAARYRDKIESLKIFGEKQKITSMKEKHVDIIGIIEDKDDFCIEVFYMRDGKVVGSEYFVFENTGEKIENVLEEFIKQFYFTVTNIPGEIHLSHHIEDEAGIENWLTEKNGHKVHISVPLKGEKAKMVQMVCKNAGESLYQHRFKRDRSEKKANLILMDLMHVLKLKKPPFRIESYDISNISGAQSVGVCVVYKNAKPSKKDYRKFNIKTVEGANDYESMREVIYRRIQKAYEEEEKIEKGELSRERAKFVELPDLILLDGGKGHVSIIRELFETMGEDIPVYGLVKNDKHQTRGLTDETIEYPLGRELFDFLTCMQDEVHRFAITTFRKKHESANLHSELESIEGIGPSKRMKLLASFSGIDRIRRATIAELSEVIDRKTAENVYWYYHEKGEEN